MKKILSTILACLFVGATPIASDPVGLTVYGDYLLWQVAQDQMHYAAVLPGGVAPLIAMANPVTQISGKGFLAEPKFEWDSGFRVGLMYEVPCSNWDLDLSWTCIQKKNTSSVSDPSFGILPTSMPVLIVLDIINGTSGSTPMIFFANHAESHWKFNFNAVDFKISRTYCFSDCSVIRPFVGLKAAEIKQCQHIEYFGTSIGGTTLFLQNRRENKFNGVGPSLGIDSSWMFAPNWSLKSGICGAFLYGKFDVSEFPEASHTPFFVEVLLQENKKDRLRPTVDAYIGIDWDTSVCDMDLKIGVAYEIQYWWNQWQASSSVPQSLLAQPSGQGDLTMSGLTVRAALAF